MTDVVSEIHDCHPAATDFAADGVPAQECVLETTAQIGHGPSTVPAGAVHR
jgi:hypothetical protein